MSYYLLSLKIQ